MCPHCAHPLDDHDGAGVCLSCAKVSQRCPGPGASSASGTPTLGLERLKAALASRASATITIHIAGGTDLVAVSMPRVATASYAAMRAAEAVGMDPDARDWFLFDPVNRVCLAEGDLMAGFDGRVLGLAWREERNP